GLEHETYVANNADIVRSSSGQAGRLQAGGEFRWVGAYGAGLKVESSLAQATDEIANGSGADPNSEQNVAVSLLTFHGAGSSSIREAVGSINLAADPIIEDRHDG